MQCVAQPVCASAEQLQQVLVHIRLLLRSALGCLPPLRCLCMLEERGESEEYKLEFQGPKQYTRGLSDPKLRLSRSDRYWSLSQYALQSASVFAYSEHYDVHKPRFPFAMRCYMVFSADLCRFIVVYV